MKKSIAFLLFIFSISLFSNLLVFGINANETSNKRVLPIPLQKNADSLLYLCNMYKYSMPVNCLKFGKQLLVVSQKINDAKRIIISYNIIGDSYRDMGDNDSALSNYRKSLSKSKEIQNKYFIAIAHNKIGQILRIFGQYANALEEHLKAGDIFRGLNDSAGISSTLNFMGNVNRDLGNFDDAFSNYNQALKICISIKDSIEIAHTLINLGNYYWYKKDIHHAYEDYMVALYVCNKIKYITEMADLENNIGNIFRERDKYVEASGHYTKALELANQIENKNLKTVVNKNIGILLLRQKKFTNAIPFIQKSIDLSRLTNQKYFLKENYLLLSEAYKSLGNIEKSYENYKLFTDLKDSLFNTEVSKKISSIEENHIKKEKSIELQSLKTIQEVNNRIVLRIIISILLFSAIIIFYIKYIQKRKYAKSLESEINERKIIEDKLKTEQELFNIMLETSSDNIYFKNLDGKYIKVSKSFAEWFQVKDPADILGKKDFDFYERNYLGSKLSEEKELIENGKIISGEIEKQTNLKGKTRWVSTTKLPLFDNTGKISGIYGVSRDITEIKEAENALRKSEEKFRYIFENAPIGIIIIDSLGQIQDVNSYLVNVLGSPSVEATKLINVLKFPLLLKAGIAQNFDKCILDGVSIFSECIYVSKWGKELNLYYRIQSIKNETGEIAGAMAIIEDVTERKKMQRNLEDSERKYRLLVESMNEGLVFVDKDDVILFVNDRMCEMLGYSRDEFIGKVGYNTFFSEEYKQLIIEKNKLRTQGISDRYLVQYKKKSGQRVWMEVGGAPVLDENGNQIGSIGIHTDVTERKKIEEEKERLIKELIHSKETIENQLNELNKLHDELIKSESNLKVLNSSKDKFFTVIAQDLRAPLTGFISLTQQITQGWEIMPLKHIAEIAGDMFVTATHLSKLLDNLLYWARSQTGRIDFSPAHYDLFDLVCNNIEDIKPVADKKKLNIENNIQKDTITYFDLQMINTVIRNILSNAVKYSNEGGTIVVSSQEYFDGIEITVSDTGVGISPENIKRIYNLNSTFSTNGTFKETGTGLGLILCKDFIEKHGGSTKVESELGKGSSFSFKIPIK